MYDALREEIVRVCRLAYEKGHVAAASGNVSARTPDAAGVVIKASGVAFACITVGDLLFVDWESNSFDCDDMASDSRAPSIELALHLAVYRARSDAGAVVHLHSPCATALSCLGGPEIRLITSEARYTLGSVPVIPETEPGSHALAQAVAEAFSDPSRQAVALAGHGIVTAGLSPYAAWQVAETMEHSARTTIMARFLGA